LVVGPGRRVSGIWGRGCTRRAAAAAYFREFSLDMHGVCVFLSPNFLSRRARFLFPRVLFPTRRVFFLSFFFLFFSFSSFLLLSHSQSIADLFFL
jgi:hypothetical protein